MEGAGGSHADSPRREDEAPYSDTGGLRSLCFHCISFACFAASNVLLPFLLGLQMGLLNYFLAIHYPSCAWRWLWVFVGWELLLLLHLVFNGSSAEAVKSGSLQWIMYCWLIAAKSGVIYFDALTVKGDFSNGTYGGLEKTLWLSPVFYCVLTFRTLRQLFRVPEPSEAEPDDLQSQGRRDMILDFVILQDMVWHVVIDMIDIVTVMFMATDTGEVNNGFTDGNMISESLKSAFPRETSVIRTACGVLVILALFFHQQSFPQVGFAVAKEPLEPRRSLNSAARDSSGCYVDVVKARKRSAVVSLLLVDLPFLIIRSYLYFLAVSAWNAGGSASKQGIRPSLDKWWVKNVMCIVLQATQLRFVQSAEIERSQTLRWWDLRQESRQSSRMGLDPKHRFKQDPALKKVWLDMERRDRALLDAAFEDGGADASPSPEHSPNFRSSPSVALEADQEDSSPSEHPPGLKGKLCCACARRCLRSGWCCCTCSFSVGFLLHMLMGIFLGWMVAKVDFTQTFGDLVVSLGSTK